MLEERNKYLIALAVGILAFVSFTILGWAIDRLAVLVSLDIDYYAYGFPWRFVYFGLAGTRDIVWEAFLADAIFSTMIGAVASWRITRSRRSEG